VSGPRRKRIRTAAVKADASFVQRAAARALALAGWRLEAPPPPEPRGIIIVYPHTSNWDFAVGYLWKLASGLPVGFVGKDSLFRGPPGALLRRMGGIPVNRRAPSGVVAELARELARREWMWIALAPEGTRSKVDHWKSGFYQLALAAKVPVALGFIDWGEKVVGIREYVRLTGDEEKDLSRIRTAYEGKVGKRPGQEGAIRFKG
jgi:1-acyl-sn-glycerol-3-phosphate acyltransferase